MLEKKANRLFFSSKALEEGVVLYPEESDIE